MHLFYRPTTYTHGLVRFVCILFSYAVFANDPPCGQRRLFKDGTELTSTFDAAYHYVEDGSVTMKDGFVAKPGFSIKPSLDCSQTRPALEELVKKYAPILVHSSQEDHEMSSVEWFLSRSDLWDEGNGTLICEAPLNDCDFPTDWIGDYEIQVRNGDHYGEFETAKAYVHIQTAYYQSGSFEESDIEIQYWFFYPYNYHTFRAARHQGDWEAVKVVVDHLGNLKFVLTSTHGDWNRYYPGSFQEEGTNPVLHVDNGSHAIGNGACVAEDCTSDYIESNGYRFESWRDEKYEIVDIDPRIVNHAVIPSNPKWLHYKGQWGGSDSEQILYWESSSSPGGPLVHWDEYYSKDPIYPSYDYTYERDDTYANEVSILGATTICDMNELTYSHSKYSSLDYSIEWSASNVYSVISGVGNTFTTKRASLEKVENGRINSEILVHHLSGYDSRYKFSKKTWLGIPTSNAFSLSESYPQSTNGYTSEGSETQTSAMPPNPPTCGNAQLKVSFVDGFIPTSVNWSRNDGNFTIEDEGWDINESFVELKAEEEGEISGAISLTLVNSCGSETIEWTIQYICEGEESAEARVIDAHEDNSVIEKVELLTNYQLYPNPTTGEVKIGLVSDGEPLTNIRAEIFDFSGRAVEAFAVDELDGSYFNLDLSGYENGLYMVRVFQEETPVFESKVLKQ